MLMLSNSASRNAPGYAKHLRMVIWLHPLKFNVSFLFRQGTDSIFNSSLFPKFVKHHLAFFLYIALLSLASTAVVWWLYQPSKHQTKDRRTPLCTLPRAAVRVRAMHRVGHMFPSSLKLICCLTQYSYSHFQVLYQFSCFRAFKIGIFH